MLLTAVGVLSFSQTRIGNPLRIALCKGGTVTEIGNALKEQLSARGGGKPFSVSGSVQATEEEIRRVLSGFGMN